MGRGLKGRRFFVFRSLDLNILYILSINVNVYLFIFVQKLSNGFNIRENLKTLHS